MPQFDPSTIATQLFWLAITFIALYLILWKAVLPRIASVLEARQDKIEDDLGRAEKLKADAEEVLADYHRSLDEARAKAQADLKEATDAMAAEAAKRQEAFGQELAGRIGDAELRIAKAKEDALESLNAVAAESAAAATARLIGLQVTTDEAAKVVAEVRQQSGRGQSSEGTG